MSASSRSSGRPTMRDVAALAGASLKTVSRVVNREDGVSPPLEARVRSAIERLGYHHNIPASSLRRGDRRTGSIGLLLEDVANPFSSALQRGVERVAREHGVMTLAVSCDEDPDRERAALAALTARRVDGIIAMPAMGDQTHLRAELAAGTPIVLVDRRPAFSGIDSVVVDNQAGARRAAEHLIAHGHKRIGFLGDRPEIPTAAQRYSGYTAALKSAGLALDPALVAQGVTSTAQAVEAVERMFGEPKPPTALFTAQNLITIGGVQWLRRAGRAFEIALVGFDDLVLADLLEPGLTVVAQDPAELGERAARRLLARIDGDLSAARREVVRTRLVERGSGELRPR